MNTTEHLSWLTMLFLLLLSLSLFSVKDVKKRWKNLRDTYREVLRKEAERCRSGAAERGPNKGWRYAAIMSFLIPFMEPRGYYSNMTPSVKVGRKATLPSAGHGTPPVSGHFAPLDPGDFILPVAGEATPPVVDEAGPSVISQNATSPVVGEANPPAAGTFGVHTFPAVTHARVTEMDEFDAKLRQQISAFLEKVQTSQSSPDMLFFKSLVPMMGKLSNRNKELLKMDIHKVVFDAVCRQEDEEGTSTDHK